MNTELIWITPHAEQLLAKMARVSNPANQDNPNIAGLIKYMWVNEHYSPFEMVSACFEVNTTRDIARQMLRHRSFSFQEFCITGDTMITLELPSGAKSGKRAAYKRSIEHLFKLQKKGQLPSGVRVFDEVTRTFVVRPIKEVFQTGVKPVFRITLDNGKTVTSTKEHKFLTSAGFLTLEDAVGLSVVNGRAVMSKTAAIGCNGIPLYQDYNFLYQAKVASLNDGSGLKGICEKLDAKIDVVRKWLKRHNIQFTKKEVASYTSIWNKGVYGYSHARHKPGTIEKMKQSARKGSTSNLWRGGADRSERLKIADWCNANRSEFLRAANYKCQCGSNEKLELHHIKSVASAPELAYEKNNIQVLCRKCHNTLHGLSGEAKSWREKSRGNALTVHWSNVAKVEYVGERMTYDMEVDHPSHNYVANGIVTHNSQRYADVSALPPVELRECRLQDTKNRQSSLPTDDKELIQWFKDSQDAVLDITNDLYEQALARGIAKEQARCLLPEGLTPSRMYMTGTLRSWLHYCQLRTDAATQKEHRLIAQSISDTLADLLPVTWSALK
jgi:thymidylate synthase (FAD)